VVRGRTPRPARVTELIGRDTTDPLDIGLTDTHRVCERGGLAAQQCLVRALHALRKQLAVMLDVLIDRTLDEFGLLEARHQRRVADLLLGGLMDLDRGLRTHNGSLGTSVPLRVSCCAGDCCSPKALQDLSRRNRGYASEQNGRRNLQRIR
jgi:hypothetical protein